jgi:cytoskeletal protein CcmA (bactofilin family)
MERMSLRYRILVGAIVALVPLTAMAAEFRSGADRIRIGPTERITDNLYVAAGEVAVEAPVDGDIFVAGGQIRVTGTIRDDLFVAGGNIQVEGPVQGDVRVAGGNISLRSDIGGDLLVAGGNVELLSGADVAGQVWASGGQVTIASTTGPVMAQAGQLRLEETAHIRGDLRYTSREEAQIAAGATVDGETVRQALPGRQDRRGLAGALTGAGLFALLVTLIMALLFIYVLPVKTAALAVSWRQNFGMNILWGLLFLLVTPILAVLLLISVVGMPLGIGVLLLYPIFLYIGQLTLVIAVGAWLRSWWDKDRGLYVDWVAAIIGVVATFIIALIPIIGALVLFIAYLAALGALVRYDWNLVRTLRRTEQI